MFGPMLRNITLDEAQTEANRFMYHSYFLVKTEKPEIMERILMPLRGQYTIAYQKDLKTSITAFREETPIEYVGDFSK